LVRDNAGNLSAATLGSRSSNNNTDVGVCSFSTGYQNKASGGNSHAEGSSVVAKGINSHAEGCTTKALENCSHAEGKFTEALGEYSHAAGFRAKAQKLAYAWSGVESDTPYDSNGEGTYNINPAQGIKGFFIGQKNLKTILSEEAPVPDLSGYVKKTASGGISLQLQYDDMGDCSPLFLGIEGAVRMGQPSSAADEALLEMQAGGRPGGFKVHVTPSYDESTWEEVSSTTVSIDDIPDVAAELRKISAKRDSTDNIAAADSVVFSPWEFSDGQSHTMVFGYEVFDPDTPVWLVDDGMFIGYPGDPNALTVTFYGNDGQVVATRTSAPITKSGEPYVTPTGVAYLSADKFHEITPKVSEGVLELLPRDNRVNYVREPLSLGVVWEVASRTLEASGSYDIEFEVSEGEFLERQFYPTFKVNVSLSSVWIPEGDDADMPFAELGLTAVDLIPVHDSETGDYIGHIPGGKTLYIQVWDYWSVPEFEDVKNPGAAVHVLEAIGESLFDYIVWEIEGDAPISPLGGCADTCILTTNSEKGGGISDVHVKLPSTKSAAHQFTLTLSADTKETFPVTWDSSTVIERFPGASSIEQGMTIFDVKEVKPGVLLIDRVPGSGTVALSSDNGSVYNLTVDSEGVLEVKEVY
jgi:hypothetical protein